jgi:hypothetical protein
MKALVIPTVLAASGSYVKAPWGIRCVVTDYDQVEGAPEATCEYPRGGNNLANVGVGGDFRWSEGNIGGFGSSITQLASGQSITIGTWGITASSDSVKFRSNTTGHGMTVNSDGTASGF